MPLLEVVLNYEGPPWKDLSFSEKQSLLREFLKLKPKPSFCMLASVVGTTKGTLLGFANRSNLCKSKKSPKGCIRAVKKKKKKR